jgi:hypothetical protein
MVSTSKHNVKREAVGLALGLQSARFPLKRRQRLPYVASRNNKNQNKSGFLLGLS